MIFAVIAVIIVVVLVLSIRIVSESNEFVIELLGKYNRTLRAGINFVIPFFERIAKKVTLKEQVLDFEPQPVITRDNVTMQIDTVVYFAIRDSKLYTYGVINPLSAIGNLTATTLRNIMGELELDEALTSRDLINTKMRAILDEATDKWGIKVHRVELKNIIPPREIQQSMEKQMKAERDRRETLLEAEGHKQAVVTREEGNKQAKILEAEGEKAAAIAKAEGEARSIELVYEAEARGLKLLQDIGGTDAMLALKSMEALQKLGDGRATKIIVPTDLASTATQLTSIGEILGIGAAEKPNQV